MKRMFGTDGVRGVANLELTPELAFRLGYAGAKVLAGGKSDKARAIIGMDTRISGDMLEAALVAGMTAAGTDAWLAGVIPTPGIAWLTRHRGFDFGIMISASHNPYEFNGIKFFSSDGFKLPDYVEDEIEAEILNHDEHDQRVRGERIGRRIAMPGAAVDYREHLKTLMKWRLDGLRLAIDCGHGAAAPIAPELFRQLGAEVTCIGVEPNGININEQCGSTHLNALQERVVQDKLDLGLAFDGDADRLMAVDHCGEVVDGDEMLCILAMDMRESGALDDLTLVATVMSNLGMEQMARENGLILKKTKVGDRYVLEEMLKGAHKLGGEQSGHMIFLEDSSTGDGILSALKLLSALKRSKRPLAEMKKIMRRYPQVLLNVTVPNKSKAAVMDAPALKQAAAAIEADLAERGRLLLRPSGTEPYVRVMLEGEDEEEIRVLAEKLAAVISDLC